MGAYSGDVFSGSTHDKLLEKLRKAKKVADNELTKSEAILVELNKHRNNLLYEIAQDKRQKERQKQIDNELRRLVATGYSIHEAETIIANTVLENLKWHHVTSALRKRGFYNEWIWIAGQQLQITP